MEYTILGALKGGKVEFRKSEKLPGVILVVPDVFEDFRGHYAMTYNRDLYRAAGIMADFLEQDISTSSKGVLRGLHVDFACEKIYEIIHGSAYYVLVDCLEGPTFGNWEAFILTGENHHQLYKPGRYGAGFLALSDLVVLHYFQDHYYDPQRQTTLLWNDPRLNIWWPTSTPILSRRDIEGHYVE